MIKLGRAILLTLLVFSMVFSSMENTYAETRAGIEFVDVPKGHWAYKEMMYMAQNKIINGYGNGYFGANDNVLREHAAAFLYRYLKPQDSSGNPYIDIESSAFKKEILALTKMGIFTVNSEKKFNPNKFLTRAEAATILVKAFNLKLLYDYDFQFLDMKGHWASDYVKVLHSNRITNGTDIGKFSPDRQTTREQFSILMYNSIHKNQMKNLMLHRDTKVYKNASFKIPFEDKTFEMGSHVRVLTDPRNGWLYVKDANGFDGWIAPYGVKVDLDKKADLYDAPRITHPTYSSLAPQKVTVTSEEDNFKEIKMGKGSKWIPNENLEVPGEVFGANFDDEQVTRASSLRNERELEEDKDSQLEMFTVVTKGDKVYAVPENEVARSSSKTMRSDSGEYFTINVSHQEQQRSTWCGPANVVQALSFHKSISGSSVSLPTQDTIAQEFGIYYNNRGSSSSHIKAAVNNFKSAHGLKGDNYILGDILNHSDPAGILISRVRDAMKNKTNAPILLVDTAYIPRYGGKSFRHYVTVSGYKSTDGLEFRIVDPLHRGNSSRTVGGVYWESVIYANLLGIHGAVRAADYYGSNAVMIY
ncbi:S-layer homology domain-containing protein [Bacillus thuringiensis]|uniref:S-layer homology domain-containing protein n=1 Tax=Bacillus thuringiensis TaxID=1428 RepID=UPI000BF8176E|nr:S-layer homology domain-containing protein [Bacillus thuringiensis]PEQ47338.1 hypothetical protein CN473_24000 [Bacillus thuringiensis]PFS47380.1 hypothetical protein COK87_28225 [Bacillus thuringiensis]